MSVSLLDSEDSLDVPTDDPEYVLLFGHGRRFSPSSQGLNSALLLMLTNRSRARP
jgi:hypothetical protein